MQRPRGPAPVPVSRLPATAGVYRFRDGNGRALYVGRAVDLRRRVGSYWGSLGDRPRLARMVAQIARIEAVSCASAHEAAWLERNLLERRMPRWNRAVGGAEVPVYIRLRCDARSATLGVVHRAAEADGGRLFGPYLGGNQVRLAVSGLERVVSLAYAADRQGGFARDMARIRGVDPTDREQMIEEVIAVLEGRPAAVQSVREALLARRGAASGADAYELAARIQAEIEALDWVVGEQRVTRPGGGDADVHAWAGGILVSFEIRDGRMMSWSQTAVSEASAHDRVAATPADWVEFAQRNAALAARLAG